MALIPEQDCLEPSRILFFALLMDSAAELDPAMVFLFWCKSLELMLLGCSQFLAAGSVKAALCLGRKKLSSLIFLLFSLKVVEDGYEFFAKRQLVTLFSAPNYCGEFDNAGAMMSVDETLMCSFQVWYLKIVPPS